MVLVCAGLGDYVDKAAAVVSVLGVEIIGQDAKLMQRIQVGNRSSARKPQLLHQYPIQNEAILRLPHAIDGVSPGIQAARNQRDRKSCGYEWARKGTGH